MGSNILEALKEQTVPQHIAIIMDGNGRWAKERGEARIFGHQNGVEAVRSTIEGAGRAGVKYLTLYAFSTENWNRPKEEVEALMLLLIKHIRSELANLMKNKVRLQTIGNTQSLPQACQDELAAAIDETKNNTGLTLVLALSYSARWEITNAMKNIAKEVEAKNIDPSQINDLLITSFMNTKNMPDPDILIRTGRECRVSNFLLWQIAYTEFYFVDKMWPDFREDDLFNIIIDFQNRERRFGKTSEQL